MYATIFGGMYFPDNDFFSMPPVIFSAGNIIKISGYTNAECYQWNALIEERNEIARLEELAKKIYGEKAVKKKAKEVKKVDKKKKDEKSKKAKDSKKARKVVQEVIVGGNNVDMFSMLLDLMCTNGGIIQVPAGAKYTIEDALSVIAYAATTTANSVEAAVSELKRKMPDAAIPSADTVFNYLYAGTSIEYLLSFFRGINSEILALTGIPDEPVDVAVDFHDRGYYGDKNDGGVRGIKAKNGTSWGHSFFTIDMLWDPKLTLDIVKLTALSKDYAILLEGVGTRVKKMGLKIGTVFLDREFFNLAAINALFNADVDFIMAAKSNKRIKEMLEEHVRENGRKPAIFKYRFRDKSSQEFYLVAIPNPDHAKDKNNPEFFLFATSIDFGTVEEFVKRVPEEYRRRWNIETGYRVKNEFKIKTCSKNGIARVLFFVVQCIMYNFLNVQKSVLSTTAHELKSLIAGDIQKYLCRGKSSNSLSLKAFYTEMTGYNAHRVMELRCQLAAT